MRMQMVMVPIMPYMLLLLFPMLFLVAFLAIRIYTIMIILLI